MGKLHIKHHISPVIIWLKVGEGKRSVERREGVYITSLRTSVFPRGRFCDGEPEYVIAVVVDAAVVVVAAAIAVVTDGDACCDGSLLGAPPFSPVKIIRGQRARGNDGRPMERLSNGTMGASRGS